MSSGNPSETEARRPRVVVLGGGFGGVGAALLSTGEDRAKAVVEWSWAGFTHERAGRITVRTDT